MKILYLTHSQVGDRSFGGSMRANAVRDGLLSIASVDTLIIHGGSAFTADVEWSASRVRGATVSRYGASPTALRERRMVSRWVAGIIAVERYDLIVAQYLDLALLVPRAERGRMIFDPDDFRKTPPAHASVAARMKIAARNLLARRLARQARHVWYANPAPDQLPPTERRSFLPNVVIAPDAARPRLAAIPDRLLMVGLFAHRPNVEGLRWFHDEILPEVVARRPGVELHVVGRCEQAIRDALPHATFHGFVEDLAAEYDRAALVIAPIRSGGGTQIKVIDAMAHERPVLASSFAHAGFAEDLKNDKHLLVASSATDWIDKCVRALEQPEQSATIADCGETIVRELYGPEHLQYLIRQTVDMLLPGRIAIDG